MWWFQPTLCGTIFRRGCCGKTEICEADDGECMGLQGQKHSLLSAGIWNLSITSLSATNFDGRVLCFKPTSINYNLYGWFLCRNCATSWFWWMWWMWSLRAVAMWSSSSFTKNNRSLQLHWLVKPKYCEISFAHYLYISDPMVLKQWWYFRVLCNISKRFHNWNGCYERTRFFSRFEFEMSFWGISYNAQHP